MAILNRREFMCLFVGTGLAVIGGKLAHELSENSPIVIQPITSPSGTIDKTPTLVPPPNTETTLLQQISDKKAHLEKYLEQTRLPDGKRLVDLTHYEVRPINDHGRIQYGVVDSPVQTRWLPFPDDRTLTNDPDFNPLQIGTPIEWDLEVATPRGTFIARFKRYFEKNISTWTFNARVFDNKFFIRILG